MDVILMRLKNMFLFSHQLTLVLGRVFKAQAMPWTKLIRPWTEQLDNVIEHAPATMIQESAIELITDVALCLSRARGALCLRRG